MKWFVVRAKIEAKEGGGYSFDWLNGYHQEGEITRLEENKAISFSWRGGSTAAFEMTRRGKGTMLVLRHTGFADPILLGTFSSRWGYFLTNMKSVLEHGIDLRSKYDWT